MVSVHRRMRTVLVLAVVGVLAAACTTGASSRSTSPRGGSSAGAAPTTTTTVGRSPGSGSAGSGSAGSVAPCSGLELAVTAGSSGAAGGHNAITILFTNTGRTACRLDGYPGVAGLDASGNQVAQAARTASGYLGGLANSASAPVPVPLQPGAIASALVEAVDNPQNGASSCPVYPALLVTPPNTTASTRVDAHGPNPSGGLWNCAAFDVHPVVPGSTGRQETATPSTPPPSSTQPVPTLGHLAGALAHGSGFGQVRPPAFSNGGDATGAVGSIAWTSWGGPTATGTGIGEYVAPGQAFAQGTQEPATIVAFDVGTCGGQYMYQQVDWFFPQHGQRFDPARAENICTGA